MVVQQKSQKHEVKKKTNLDIQIEKIIFARTFPKKREFLLIYYFTKPKNVSQAKAGEKFREIKWVDPSEVKKYFKTSVDQEILQFLKNLKSGAS